MNERYIDKNILLIWLENMCVSEYIRKCINNDEKWPPVNVKEKTYAKFTMYLNHCVCSNCKTQFRFDRSDPNTYINLNNINYCPKCGAEITNTFLYKR